MKESAAIGIIGGADGPTAIIVSGNPIALITAAVIAVVVIGLVVHHLLKK